MKAALSGYRFQFLQLAQLPKTPLHSGTAALEKCFPEHVHPGQECFAPARGIWDD